MTNTLAPVRDFPKIAVFSGGDDVAGKMYRQTRQFARADGSKVSREILTLEKVPVFRTGTYRDSWGDQMTFEKLQVQQMMTNNAHLSQTKIFDRVPVRKGHSSPFTNSMDELIGYITGFELEDLKNPVDGETYSYVLATYDILDGDAADKIESGLWVNRSAEISTFVTNDEVPYAPTFMGFAYVDIPAIEGLNFGRFSKSANYNKETPVANTTVDPNAADAGKGDPKNKTGDGNGSGDSATQNSEPKDDPTEGTPAPAPTSAEDQLDPATVTATQSPSGAPGSAVVTSSAAPAAQMDDDEFLDEDDTPIPVTEVLVPPILPVGNEDRVEGEPVVQGAPGSQVVTPPPTDEPASNNGDQIPVTEQPQGPIFARFDEKRKMFTIGNRQIGLAQFGLIADYIQRLETERYNFSMSAREQAITQLANDNKILASSLDKTIAFAKGMTPEQWTDWLSMQTEVPSNPIFSRHQGGVQGGGPALVADRNEFEIQKGIVEQHRARRMAEPEVRKTGSYAKAKSLAEVLGESWE